MYFRYMVYKYNILYRINLNKEVNWVLIYPEENFNLHIISISVTEYLLILMNSSWLVFRIASQYDGIYEYANSAKNGSRTRKGS